MTIEFETDGSTRHALEGNPTTTAYQLVRSVTTIGKPAARLDEPDFRRINDSAQLMVKEGDGTWRPHTSGVDAVIEELLPWDLRDFFVMDADEAADFVGGSENKVINRKDVEAKTTAAVHSLLGIDIFKKAAERVNRVANEFGAAATRAIGDADLDALQAEVEQLREERSELIDRLKDERAQHAELSDLFDQRQDDLETELKGVGAAEELHVRLAANRAQLERATKQRAVALSHLASELESTDLLASLAGREVRATYGILKPLYDQGHIPLKHLAFVRDLLATGTCVCGQDLVEDGMHRRHVEDRIAESEGQEERANYLGQLHDAAKGLMAHLEEQRWEERRHRLTAELADFERQISDAGLEQRDIESKLDAIDEDKIQIIRDEIAALRLQLATLDRNINLRDSQLPPLHSRIDSLEKQINQRQRSERAASDKRAAQTMSRLVHQILSRGYATIQEEQVRELSQRMNRLFAHMVANVSDEDFDEVQRNKATLKMIAEIGIRPLEGDPDSFEIYALNSRGRAMPPIEINGASRRVMALSFVLALCIESRTQAPLIADSLLNFMSGTVRRNTLRVTAENSSQPILLLTGSDLEAHSEIETVAGTAGATYTLTGQWDAIDAGGGGDVVNWTSAAPVSLVCTCGPRQYCSICERLGQAGAPGWSMRVEGPHR